MSRITRTLIAIAVFSITVFLTHESLAAGFSKGNEFQTTYISGYVTAMCPNQNGGGYQHSTVSCAAQLWSPDIADYFVGPQADANKVALHATRADGSQRSKESDYDGQKGVSKSRFNLGISTLTQRPLLKSGKNSIHFVLSKNGQPVSEGQFEANVVPQPELRCRAGFYNGFSPYDCQNQTRICDQYFEQENYCQ